MTEKEVEYLFRSQKNLRFQNSSDCEKARCVVANFSKGVPYNVMFKRVPTNLTGAANRSL